jgi:hypothetical protein
MPSQQQQQQQQHLLRKSSSSSSSTQKSISSTDLELRARPRLASLNRRVAGRRVGSLSSLFLLEPVVHRAAVHDGMKSTSRPSSRPSTSTGSFDSNHVFGARTVASKW